MADWLSAVGDIGASIFSGIGSAVGASTAAASNEKINAQNIAFQREVNAEQVRLANSAHQREASDLKAAGLNPILSLGQGPGLSTPSLTAPRANQIYPNSAATLAGAFTQGFAQGAQTFAQVGLNTAQTAKTEADTTKTLSEVPLVQQQAKNAVIDGDMKQIQILNLNSTNELIHSQIRNTDIESALKSQQKDNHELQGVLLKQGIKANLPIVQRALVIAQTQVEQDRKFLIQAQTAHTAAAVTQTQQHTENARIQQRILDNERKISEFNALIRADEAEVRIDAAGKFTARVRDAMSMLPYADLLQFKQMNRSSTVTNYVDPSTGEIKPAMVKEHFRYE